MVYQYISTSLLSERIEAIIILCSCCCMIAVQYIFYLPQVRSMDSESKSLVRKICLDFWVLVCVAFPLLAFMLWIEPQHRGYFADDLTLMLPYKTSTISTGNIIIVGFTLNIVTVLVVEIVRGRRSQIIIGNHRLLGFDVPVWLWESYKVLGAFLFGAACQQLTTTVGKYSVGRLRPHFIDVCNPLMVNPTLNHSYIEEYTCQGTDAGRLKDMRLSFPSAHSAFGAYATVFFAMYLQARFKWGSRLLLHGLQFAAILFGWYTGLSRVADHMHHWSDVLAGFLIGIIYAVLVETHSSEDNSIPWRYGKRKTSRNVDLRNLVSTTKGCSEGVLRTCAESVPEIDATTRNKGSKFIKTVPIVVPIDQT